MDSSSIKRVGIVVKPHQPDALKTLCGLVEWLDKRGLALALSYDRGLGWVTLLERRVAEARALFAEGVALCQELGDRWGLASALWSLGAAVRRDDPARRAPDPGGERGAVSGGG